MMAMMRRARATPPVARASRGISDAEIRQPKPPSSNGSPASSAPIVAARAARFAEVGRQPRDVEPPAVREARVLHAQQPDGRLRHEQPPRRCRLRRGGLARSAATARARPCSPSGARPGRRGTTGRTQSPRSTPSDAEQLEGAAPRHELQDVHDQQRRERSAPPRRQPQDRLGALALPARQPGREHARQFGKRAGFAAPNSVARRR